MNMLAAEFHQPVGNELPLVAFVRIALAPAVCVASLMLCMLAHGEPYTWLYGSLAIVAFLVTARVYGELPLTNGNSRFLPGRAVLTDWLMVIAVLLFLGFVTKYSGLYSRKVLLTWFVVTPFLLHGAQAGARRLLHSLVAASDAARSKVIVGVDDIGCELARQIREDPCQGVVKGFFDDRYNDRLSGVKPDEILGRLADVVTYLKQHAVNVVYIALPMSRDPRITRLLEELSDTTASVYFVPRTPGLDLAQARVDRIGDVPVIALRETPLHGVKGAMKRAFDIVMAILVLGLLSPLLLAIAAGVKWSSPGPVLCRQRRCTLDGKEILVYRFRTMTACEDAAHAGARVTRPGAFLRRTSLDELPQFLNVLEGTMSIVGPRPHPVVHNEEYRRLLDGYMLRHKVKPGITGWAQVNGFRGESESVHKMKERIRHELDYVKHWSLSLDLWIILKTAFGVLSRRSVY